MVNNAVSDGCTWEVGKDERSVSVGDSNFLSVQQTSLSVSVAL